MKQSIIIDTNVICALYNREDSLYEKAQRVKPLFTEYKPVVSNFILVEIYTILSQRVSKKFSIEFGENIDRDRVFTVVWINRKLEKDVWSIFASIKDKNFSYVDASILAVMKKEKIKHLLSFDAGFEGIQEQFRFKLIGS